MHGTIDQLKDIPEYKRAPKTSDRSHEFKHYGMTEAELAEYKQRDKKT